MILIKKLLLSLFLPLSLFASNALNNSVVKIFSTTKEYSFIRPWASPRVSRTTGSGFIIEGNQIITNAHCVSNTTFIEVCTDLNKKKFVAKIKMIGHDCDLALLEIEDVSFFEGKAPLRFSDQTFHRGKSIQVYGFPIGGNDLSVTQGIVSRIELHTYAHSNEDLLISQIDAPINGGNSGGPVISNGEVVGITHQVHAERQNIGYMIPLPLIRHFLADNPQNYQGFPCAPFIYQKIENKGLRRYYKLEDDDGGILVMDVPNSHFLHGFLKRGDILLEFDGHSISSLGTVFFQEADLNIPFQHIISMKSFGNPISLIVLRDGEKIELEGILNHTKKGKRLAPYDTFEKKPTYYIYGGCIFQPLTGNLLRLWESAPVDLLYHALRGKIKKERDEIVVLSDVLDHPINAGYQDSGGKIIDKVNGKKIINLKDLITHLTQKEFLVVNSLALEMPFGLL